MTIAARNLIWGIRRRTIVSDVSLDVAQGETLGLIGPNGSGKSSLLRLLAGLKRPQAGLVEIEGQDIARLPRRALARQLAFVRQSAATEIIVLEAGRVVACGTPEAVLTAELLRSVFRVEAEIAASTTTGPPHIRFRA